MKKRFFALLLASLTALSVLAALPAAAKKSGDWDYTAKDGEARINKYLGSNESVTVPAEIAGNRVTTIDVGAFKNLTFIKEVKVPATVKQIANSAFSACASLIKISLSDNLTSIGQNAFKDCASLTEIAIPDEVTSIGSSAFSGCSSLVRATLPAAATSLGENLFKDCVSLSDVEIPDGVTVIPRALFRGCKALGVVAIPGSVQVICGYAFCGCEKLTSVTIPKSVTAIEASAFAKCPSLRKVYYDGTRTDWNAIAVASENPGIDRSAIYCEWRRHGDLIYTLDENGGAVIAGDVGECASVSIPAAIGDHPVKTIGAYAFFGRDTLVGATIPESVTRIEAGAFQNCASLASPKLPENLSFIGESAFDGCAGFMTLSIPKNVRTIGDRAFKDCAGLTKLIFHSEALDSFGNDVFDNVGKDAEDKTAVVFGESVSKVPARMFYSDSDDVVFNVASALFAGSNVTEIGNSAFRACRVMTVTSIPASVKKIGYRAYDECAALRTVYFGGDEAKWNEIKRGTTNDALLKADIIFGRMPPVDASEGHDGAIYVESGDAGDVNGDGAINAKDVTSLMKHIVGKTPKSFALRAADFNSDGKVNAKDVVSIMRAIVAK